MELPEILLVIMVVLAGIVTVFMVVWLMNETAAQQQRELTDLVETAVGAAQQSLRTESGAARKAYARRFLTDCGYAPDDPIVDNKIEAAALHVRNL